MSLLIPAIDRVGDLAVSGLTLVENYLDRNFFGEFENENKARNQGIMSIPGFLTGDYVTLPLRKSLDKLGYTTSPSGITFANLGPKKNGELIQGKLKKNLEGLCEQTNEKAIIVGWSLGGVIGRELAREMPDHISKVITIASPFADLWNSSEKLRNFRNKIIQPLTLFSGVELTPKISRRIATPIDVDHYNIYTKNDGVVNWESCICKEDSEIVRMNKENENHFSIGFSSDVIKLIDQYARE